MRKLFLLFLVLGVSILGMAQQTKLLTGEKHNEYGIVYSLPLTAFEIEVVAVKQTSVAGQYSKYAKIFTSESNVITKNNVEWQIESVKVRPYGIPDDENRFLMQVKAGSPTFVCVADDGMLLAINKEVAAPVYMAADIIEIEGTPATGREYLQFVNEDFLAAHSSYKKAQIIAQEIMEIRDAKISLTRGTAESMPTDGRQLEIMLTALDNQEKALMSSFTGSTWKERVMRTFTYVPEGEGRSEICRLSPADGIIDPGSGKGEPVMISVKVVEEASLPLDSKGEEKKLPKDAVMYRIPGVAEVAVSVKGNKMFEREFPMSQFGMNFGINPSVFTDKKEPSFAVFDPTTGALKEMGTIK